MIEAFIAAKEFAGIVTLMSNARDAPSLAAECRSAKATLSMGGLLSRETIRRAGSVRLPPLHWQMHLRIP